MEENINIQQLTSNKSSSQDLSRPSGFENFKNETSSTSNCSTSFARFRKKDIKGFSLNNEMNRIIEVGDSLGYDVRGCRKSLKKMIDAWHEGKWKILDGGYFMINIYGPQDSSAKATLWNRIDDFMRHNNGAFVLFGDLNEVRFDFERLGSAFSQAEANTFNTFITNNGLIELPIRCRLFTWMNKAGTKLSKLDRFLLFDIIIAALHDAQVIALDRLKNLDLHQKSRIKWDNEGDENSKFFHGLVNQRRRTNSIQGIMSDDKIIDVPFILSEMIDWYKKQNKKMLTFKVDFENAFDSVSWKYLDYMLHNLGFYLTWRSWIEACLESSRTSILVNGSPTSKFSVKHGLRHGDPLSPLLFIIVKEGLHMDLSEASHSCLIHGIKIGSSNITLLHIFYADDVVITTDWSPLDMENIICVLQVSYFTSGLKINIHKSNVYGVGVFDNEVHSMENNIGCSPGSFPLLYLGLPIGANMNLTVSWKGGNHDVRKLAWVKLHIVLASHVKGGLVIGSLNTFNLALLQKWRWMIISNANALWVKVVKAFHGQEGGFGLNENSSNGIWSKIVGSSNYLHSNAILPSDSILFRVGCGTSIRNERSS
ncbi:RNA-directed DNA polymerase, eukaryota, reverse transcriptase zinc-binding domain protein [Tanacetum coccineum]